MMFETMVELLYIRLIRFDALNYSAYSLHCVRMCVNKCRLIFVR